MAASAETMKKARKAVAMITGLQEKEGLSMSAALKKKGMPVGTYYRYQVLTKRAGKKAKAEKKATYKKRQSPRHMTVKIDHPPASGRSDEVVAIVFKGSSQSVSDAVAAALSGGEK